MRLFDPFNMMRPALEAATILAESNVVIGLRVTGMMGLWPMAPAETSRMMTEKLQAGVDSGHAALWAGMAGGSLSHVAMAAMAPVRHKTRSNAKRLQRNLAGA